MTDDDLPSFCEAMTALAVGLGEELTEQRARLYFAALGDLEIGEVRTAVKRGLRQCRFFPRPVELRELVRRKPEYILNVGAYGDLLRNASKSQQRPSLLEIEERQREAYPPADVAAVATAARVSVEAAVERHQAAEAKRREMTPDEIAARKAELRAQLALVKP